MELKSFIKVIKLSKVCRMVSSSIGPTSLWKGEVWTQRHTPQKKKDDVRRQEAETAFFKTRKRT